MPLTSTATRLATVLEQGGITATYQPIVDLDAGEVVAFEALARGPADSPLHLPAALFAAARREDRLGELDRACRTAAVAGARAAHIGREVALFVNVEPSSLAAEGAPDAGVPELVAPDLRIVVEVTERALAHSPGRLLSTLRRAREAGMSIAIDDFGAEEAALALLPFIAPDVIKLDLSLIQGRPTADVARWISAALAEAERSGATILAEGIETEAQLERARAIGARLGQGWHLGRPGPLPASVRPRASWRPARTACSGRGPGSPFDVVSPVRETRQCTKPMLVALSHHLEALAETMASPGVVMSAFQHRRHYTPATMRRYGHLAEICAFTAAFGEGLTPDPARGVRSADLRPDDPLRGEWSVVVVGPHEAVALVARDLGDAGPDHLRRFEYAVTHDRALVVAAAHTLLSRL